MSVIGWNNARISDIRIHQELRTAAGLPINEADDGWKAARSGGVDVKLTVSVKLEEDAHSVESKKNINDRDTAEIDAGNVEPVSDQAAERIVRMISMIFVTRKGL